MDDEMEDIELEHFPKHLPLRPQKRSRVLVLLKRQPIRIALTILCFLATFAGALLGAMYVGKILQKSYFEKHPLAAAKGVTTVMVTHTDVQTMRFDMPVLQPQSVVVVTQTVPFSKPAPETSTVHISVIVTATGKPRVTASPGRQKPEN